MTTVPRAAPALLDPAILFPALRQAFGKLDPRLLWRNPVMFVVEIVTVLTTILFLRDLAIGRPHPGFALQINLWLWFTLLFAAFAEAVAEGRGKAQADSMRRLRTDTAAERERPDGTTETIAAAALRPGDIVVVGPGAIIPSDGVVSDTLRIRITAAQGSTFLDRMIALVEGAARQKTPNEIALNILLAGLTLVFVLAVATIPAFAAYAGGSADVLVLVALFVTLIPTTIGALLSAIGIAGMDRLVRFNVLVMSGRAVEAAGDVDTILLDKTGTITLGNRQASAFLPLAGVTERALAEAAHLASLADETPEGRSIVTLATERHGPAPALAESATFIPFTAQTRMSGIDLPGRPIRKGAVDSVLAYVLKLEGANTQAATEARAIAERIGRAGGTPLAVADGVRLLGVIELKDIVKHGIAARFAELRRMGIRTVMITGDNPMTAAAIAAEAGVDDFLAQATPEAKLALIRHEQAQGKLVAMCGDGTNDAPALAQADVGVAMNTGTVAAREAGNMVDLDSDPTKLIEIIEIGKQLLMTRGALTTFSIANDVAKYFAIIPALFLAFYPQLGALNVMHLATPQSAILSAIIFNALVIVALIPLALRGVRYRSVGAAALLRRNLLIYGAGGLVAPFAGIKLIDLLVSALGLA